MGESRSLELAPGRAGASEAFEGLPGDWRRYCVPQRHASYGHAANETWQRLLDQTAELVEQLKPRLHPAYVDGFRRLIQPWSKIPCVAAVNEALAEFGWATTCVDGYLPPHVYAALLARGIFPVARQIRRRQHLEFSPIPDLAHDLLGHLPMLVSSEHGQFLRRLAGAMASAKSSPLDHQLYLANRDCALLRCSPGCSRSQISLAERRVQRIQRALRRQPSALTRLGRMYLWTIEFGLMGTLRDFRIYGAGLLSSPAEMLEVCRGRSTIREFSLRAVHRDIDFSDLQTAYYVAPEFESLDRSLIALQRRAALAGVEASPKASLIAHP